MTAVLIALGSNRLHGRHGRPAGVIAAAVAALGARAVASVRLSSIHRTRAIGPGGRDFANAVLLAETTASPTMLLHDLKEIERLFGRRRGRTWGARVLDLDILAYGDAVVPSRPAWRRGRGLVIPHRALHLRRFVLDPLTEIAPDWRHPVLKLTARQLRARLTAPRARPNPGAAGP